MTNQISHKYLKEYHSAAVGFNTNHQHPLHSPRQWKQGSDSALHHQLNLYFFFNEQLLSSSIESWVVSINESFSRICKMNRRNAQQQHLIYTSIGSLDLMNLLTLITMTAEGCDHTSTLEKNTWWVSLESFKITTSNYNQDC